MGNDKITFKYNDVEIIIKNGKVKVKNNDIDDFEEGLISVFKSIVRNDKLEDLKTIFKNTGTEKEDPLVIDEDDKKFLMQFTKSLQSTDVSIAKKINEELLRIETKKIPKM